MSKNSFTHYYVQAQKEGGLPEIVAHTYDEEEDEYYHKFLERVKANKLRDEEKKLEPTTLFRVVKCVETFTAGDWV